jgi:hypothetical protein
MEKSVFLNFCHGPFQEAMERAYELDRAPNPEERPFDSRYSARKIYQDLLQDPHLVLKTIEPIKEEEDNFQEENEESPADKASLNGGPIESIEVQDLRWGLTGVIKLFLADNFFETEENSQAYDHYKTALVAFQNIFDKNLI